MKKVSIKRSATQAVACIAVALLILVAGSAAAQEKPNILVIWGDDIGYDNISAYNLGMMGYQTPNIDRLAAEGILFENATTVELYGCAMFSVLLSLHAFRSEVERPCANNATLLSIACVGVMSVHLGFAGWVAAIYLACVMFEPV